MGETSALTQRGPAREAPPAFEPGLDHFRRLGVQPGVELDRAELESAYHARAAAVHPDAFVTADAATRRRAMEHSSALNEAYATLRDPVRRLEYLLALGGIDLDSDEREGGAPRPAQAFLVEMLEAREALEQAREGGAEALEEQLDAAIAARDDRLARARVALAQGSLPAAAEALVARRYYARLVSELEAALDEVS